MPVYMITIHTYRSWTEDHQDGFYQRGECGVQPPNDDLAHKRARLAKAPPLRLDPAQQEHVIEQAFDILKKRGIRPHAASCTETHLHIVASWFGSETIFDGVENVAEQANHLANKLKNVLATLLSKRDGTTGNRWFSRGKACTLVEDRKHLNHLLDHYLPKHAEENGLVRVFDAGKTD